MPSQEKTRSRRGWWTGPRAFLLVTVSLCLGLWIGLSAGTALPGGASAAPSSSNSGYWKLVKIELGKPDKLDLPANVVSASTQERNFVTTLRGKDRNTGQFTGAEQVVSWTWTPIPRVVRAGQALPFTVTLNHVKSEGNLGILQATGRVLFHTRGQDGGLWGEPVGWVNDSDGKGNGQKVGGGPADKGTVSAVTYTDLGTYELRGTGEIPKGSGQMAIVVNIDHAGRSWYWTYIYDWVAATPPAKSGKPVPPATTDLETTTQGEPDTKPDGPATETTGGMDCLDPKFQQCVDEWQRMAVSILNKNRPELGPWSISPYGHILNKSIIDFRKPDDWETKYRSSRACFVWAEYRGEHTRKDYKGELPSLEDYMRTCYGTTTTRPEGKKPDRDSLDHADGGRILQAPRLTVESGKTVLVPVSLIRPDGVANMNYNLNYDPAVARPEGKSSRGNLLNSSAIFSANPAESGRVRLGFARTEGLQRTGTVALIPFRAVGKPGTCTPLTLEALETQDANHESLPIKLIHGEICIVSQNILGDCTGDGTLTAADAQCALDISVGLRPTLECVDMDKNGSVTSGDAQIILRNLQWGRGQ